MNAIEREPHPDDTPREESVVGIRLPPVRDVGSEREADGGRKAGGDDHGASTEEGDPGEIETEEVEEE